MYKLEWLLKDGKDKRPSTNGTWYLEFLIVMLIKIY